MAPQTVDSTEYQTAVHLAVQMVALTAGNSADWMVHWWVVPKAGYLAARKAALRARHWAGTLAVLRAAQKVACLVVGMVEL